MDSATTEPTPDGPLNPGDAGLAPQSNFEESPAELSEMSATSAAPEEPKPEGPRAFRAPHRRPAWLYRLIDWSSGLELITAVSLTIAAIVLHVVVYRHAGGLWRDEINSVSLAGMESLTEIWKHIEYDSFPIFWVLVLRVFQQFFGDGDTAYRVLGCSVGIACLVALWWSSRRLTHGPPLISIALVGMSPVVLRFGDSLRAWGFGVFWMWLMVAAVWDFAREPTKKRWFWATLVGVLSVQATYYNALLLFAVAMGGCTVCFVRRDWKAIIAILGAGLIAALTLLPYSGPIAQHRSWVILVEVDLSYQTLIGKWEAALAAAGQDMASVWRIVFGLAVLGGVFRWFWPDKTQRGNRDIALFCVVSLLVGSGLYLLLIKQMHRITESWYYLTWMAFAGLLADAAISSLMGSDSERRFIRLAAAVGIAVHVYPTVWSECHVRHSNVDIIAKNLTQVVGPNDLIAILNWESGITFQRYYHGKARWLTVPDIPEHRIHRYDLVKQKMENPTSINDAIIVGINALNSGGKLWIVGDPSVNLERGSYIPPPPPLPGTGWHLSGYGDAWSQEFKFQLGVRVNDMEPYDIGTNLPLAGYERSLLQMWQKRR